MKGNSVPFSLKILNSSGERIGQSQGMIDESMDKEQMEKPPQPWEFRTKPVWQRLIIMLGGVTVNLILGFFIYMMILFVWGKNTLPNSALPMGMGVSSLGKEIGFKKGDQILMVDGKPLEVALDINKMLLIRSVEEVQVQRANGNIVTLEIPIAVSYTHLTLPTTPYV